MFSWPAFFGAALVIWLLLRGPAAETPIWVQKACHAAMAFFLYGGFLSLEMDYVLAGDAGNRVGPNQDRRFSDSDIDARLADCDTTNLASGAPNLCCPFTCP